MARIRRLRVGALFPALIVAGLIGWFGGSMVTIFACVGLLLGGYSWWNLRRTVGNGPAAIVGGFIAGPSLVAAVVVSLI